MAPSISQRITLDGAEEIKKQLQEIGAAGASALRQLQNTIAAAKFEGMAHAFDQIKAAGDRFSSGIKQIGNDLAPLGNGLRTIGEAAGIAFGGGIIGAVGALVLMSKSSVDAVFQTGQLAKSLGLTVAQFEQWKFAAQRAGVSTDQLVSGLSQFSRQAQTTGEQQITTLIGLAKLMTQSFQGAGVGLMQFIEPVSVTLAKLRPVAEQLRAQFQQTGDIFLKGLSTDQIVFQLQTLQSQGKLTAETLNTLGAGLKPINALEQLDKILNQNSGDLTKLGVSLLDANGKFVGTDEALSRVADLFKTLPDGFQKTSLAAHLFGRELGPQMIPILQQGRDGIDALKKEFDALNLGLSEADRKTAAAAKGSFLQLDAAAERLKTSLGLVFALPLTDAANAFARAIQDNRDKIVQFAERISATVLPVVHDLINLMSGRGDLVQNQWILDWRDAITGMAGKVQSAFENVIKPAFHDLMNILNGAAAAINSLFGTNLSGTDLGIGLLIGQITGLNGALLDVIKTAALVGAALLTAFGGQVLAAIGLVVLAITGAIKLAGLLASKFPNSNAFTIPFSDPTALAEGGLFRGKPGRDTNLAWLTDREYVMNPDAVRKYGVGFMHMINSLRFPLDALRGFSLGGLVESVNRSLAIPGFATGGLNLTPLAVPALAGSRGRPLTLVLDGRSFGGLTAPDDVAESLVRFARARNRASAGRAPSRVR